MTTLERAKREDLAAYAAIIEDAKLFQREQGFVQWTDDYPNADTVAQDMDLGRGYALEVDGQVAGYLCLDFGGEPDYDEIQGEWRLDAPYAVVHRMALHRSFRGRGLAETTFRLVEERCRQQGFTYLRIDTDPQNQRMQHVLTRSGFTYCGVIFFQGGGKAAFDKIL